MLKKETHKKYKEDEIMTAYINFISLSQTNKEEKSINKIQKKSILKPFIPKTLGISLISKTRIFKISTSTDFR